MNFIAKKIVLFLIACTLIGVAALFWKVSVPSPRTLDPNPITKQMGTGLVEPGTAHVALEIVTSGDQMGMGPIQAGLRLIVQYGTTMQHQLFASCNDAGFMGVSPDLPPFPIEALCDGRTIEISPVDKLILVKEILGSDEKILAQIQLPQEIQTITRNDELHSN